MVIKRKITLIFSLTLIIMILLQSTPVNGVTQESSETNKVTEGNKVLFARNNGYFSPLSAYSQMSAYFSAEGYIVEEVQSEINETILQDVGILFVNTYQVGTFNQSEIVAIESFVHSGGGLIMSASGGGLDFGVKLASNLGVINSHTLEIHPSPVSESLPTPFINASSGVFEIILSGTGRTAITTDAGSYLPNIPIIAVNSYGEGKILVSAAGTTWVDTYWNVGGNDDLIENYLRWFETEGVKKVVFARNNGYFSISNAYGQMAALFDTYGYFVEEIPAEINETVLTGVSVLIVNTYQISGFNQSEITAIEEFVSAGGGLIMSMSGGGLDFGLRVHIFGMSKLLYDNDSYHIHYHPVTAGITDVSVTSGSGATKFDLAETATVVVSTTADSNTPERPIIAVNNYQQGKVMGCAVGGIWDGNYNFNQNKDLIDNFLDWSTTNTTTPIPWISSPPDVDYDEGSVGNNLSWSIGSHYPYYYQIFLDGNTFQSGSWSSYPLTVSINGLSVGTHTFSITVYDHFGRTAVDTVDVTVHEVADPLTTTETTTNVSTPFSFLATILGIVMVGLIGYYKRQRK